METEKSHHLPSSSWRTRKAGGIIPVQTWRPENPGSQWYKSRSESKGPRVRSADVWGRRRWMSQLKQSKFALPPPFCSVWNLNRLDGAEPHWWGESSLLILPIQMLTSPGSNLTDTPRNHALPALWASLSSVQLTHKFNYHRFPLRLSAFLVQALCDFATWPVS